MISEEVAARFWAKVEQTASCWIWRASLASNGYGQMRIGGRVRSAHRIAFELAGGDPNAPIILHACDNKLCVNPAHLSGGTQRANMRDCRGKGRLHAAKIKPEMAALIRQRVDAGEKRSAIARELGLSKSHVAKIARGERWGG